MISAHDGTGNVSEVSFLPHSMEEELAVLCCPGGLRL